LKLEKILVTTDFSPLSRLAFSAAASLARKFKGEIHLVHVMEPVPSDVFFSPEGIQTYSPEVDYPLKYRDLLARTAQIEPSFRGLSVKTHLLEGGYVHERLKAFQEHQRIDLTVISTHGRTGLGYLFLGSFAEKVVRLSTCPVLTYRPGPGTKSEEEFAPRRILVPYDFSENAGQILELVRLFLDAYGGQARFQHVVEVLPDLALTPLEGLAPEELNLRQADLPERALRQLEAIVEKELPGRRADVIAEQGVPFVEVVRAAREFQADLIVMATHGWTGLKHMLLGSVAEKVVRKASCSVLTVRPAGMTFEHP
jgi:nucleotide-binding universal stress UspA family protein